MPQVDGEELKTLRPSAERFARLSKQFIRVPQQPIEPAPYRFPPGIVPPKAEPARELVPATPVLSKGDIEIAGDGFVAS